MRPLRDDGRADLRHIHAEAAQDHESRSARNQAQIDRQSVKIGGHRHREQEEQRGKHALLRHAPPVEGPRHRHAQPDEAKLLKTYLRATRADERHADARKAGEEPPNGRGPGLLLQFRTLRPKHIKRKDGYEPAVRHVLQRIAENKAQAKIHAGESDQHAHDRRHKRAKAQVILPLLHRDCHYTIITHA